MKQILSLVTIIVLSFTVRAQIKQADISVTVTSPANHAIIAPNDSFWLSFAFTNNGPDLLPAGDSLFFVTTGNLIVFAKLSTELQIGGTVMVENILKIWNSTNDTVVKNFCVFHIPQSLATYVHGGHPITTYEDDNTLNDTSCVTVKMAPPSSSGINSTVTHKNQFDLFPNPAKDHLFVTPLEANKNIEFSIINTLGQTVWQNILHSGMDKTIKIEVSALPAGFFYLQQNLDGKKASVKFVK
ncbi:MAG: T9SS type A sorting domain-containing protein [Sphingobacteriales bacterium]|nr:MAG: T9SS type A sorting domain-containing protein [Sphingobacteriales bacterium]